MVAIALPTTTTPIRTAPVRSRRSLPSAGSGGDRPSLRLVTSPGAPSGTLRRLLAVLGVLVVALAALALALTPAPVPGRSAAGTASYVADAGDTMWSIAVAHAPAGEAATYVESLVEANGTARVVPGQAVALPGR